MNTSSTNQFGLMVAYLLPGFIVLVGTAPFSPIVSAWLVPLNQAEASLGAPLYAVLAATTIGMIVSCLRWILIDHLHHSTGLIPPRWDDDRLPGRIEAFNYVVENHFRYYQNYSNTLISVAIAYTVNRLAGTSTILGPGTDAGVVILCAVLFVGSRDALSKYYARTIRLIGHISEKGGTAMTNGNHQDAAGTTSGRARPQPLPKPSADPKSGQAKVGTPVKERPSSKQR